MLLQDVRWAVPLRAEGTVMVTAAYRWLPRRIPRIRVPEFDPYRPVQITIPSHEQFVPEVRRSSSG